MHKWQVIALATLAVLLLVGGLAAMVVPEAYGGREVYRIDERYSLRILHLAGVASLAAGCLTAWAAGILWQHRTGGS